MERDSDLGFGGVLVEMGVKVVTVVVVVGWGLCFWKVGCWVWREETVRERGERSCVNEDIGSYFS